MAIYTNMYLLVFLPVVLIIYQLVPRKARWCVLLAASYILYISFSKYLVLLLIATSAFTWRIGLWMDKDHSTVTHYCTLLEDAMQYPKMFAELLTKRKTFLKELREYDKRHL